MEFGALRCTPSQPDCAACPLAGKCLARAAGTVAARPVKQGKTRVRTRWFNYLVIVGDGRTLLRRREESDIWQGLYEFPLIESPRALDYAELAATEAFARLTQGFRFHPAGSVSLPAHRLSHQEIRAVFHRLECTGEPEAPGYSTVELAALRRYAVPRLIERYLLR